MNVRLTLAACALLSSLAAGSATFAATAPMSKMDMDKMTACKAMTMDMMKKDAKCMEMMKMHPDMMKSTGAMAPKGAMTPGMPAKK